MDRDIVARCRPATRRLIRATLDALDGAFDELVLERFLEKLISVSRGLMSLPAIVEILRRAARPRLVWESPRDPQRECRDIDLAVAQNATTIIDLALRDAAKSEILAGGTNMYAVVDATLHRVLVSLVVMPRGGLASELGARHYHEVADRIHTLYAGVVARAVQALLTRPDRRRLRLRRHVRHLAASDDLLLGPTA